MYFKRFFSTQIIKTGFLAGLLNLLISPNAVSAIDEIYRLSAGISLESYNTNLSINSRDSSVGTEISFEDDLGFNNNTSARWISGWYRVGELHRLRLTYTPFNRAASTTNIKDIVVDNTTIKAGASISSEVRSEILDFSYIYSFYKTPELELGFSTGIYWLFNSSKITASGNIQAEGDDQAEFKADYFSEQKLQAPMPLLGLSINYEIIPAWRSHASIRYLSLQLSETEGRIFSAEMGTEYYFNDNLGVGLSIATFELDVEIKRIITNTSLGWSHNGIQIYAVYKY